MSEQQYRAGWNAAVDKAQEELVRQDQFSERTLRILDELRIERPVPTTDEHCTGGDDCTAPKHIHGCFADWGGCSDPDEHPSVPTREQIAEATEEILDALNVPYDRASEAERVDSIVTALLSQPNGERRD